MDEKTKLIAELNDQCRQCVMIPVFGKAPCKVYETCGIAALSPEDRVMIAAKVRNFDNFKDGNNPYGERDFGAFEHNGQNVFWKIDYYDSDMKYGSEDPSDPKKTTRVLTIMLASEY